MGEHGSDRSLEPDSVQAGSTCQILDPGGDGFEPDTSPPLVPGPTRIETQHEGASSPVQTTFEGPGFETSRSEQSIETIHHPGAIEPDSSSYVLPQMNSARRSHSVLPLRPLFFETTYPLTCSPSTAWSRILYQVLYQSHTSARRPC